MAKMPETFKDTCLSFSERTTLHGIAFMTNIKFPNFRKACWICMMILIYAGFIRVFAYYLNEYWEYNYVEITKIEDETKQRFPAITFCNVNLFSRTLMVERRPVMHEIIEATSNNESFNHIHEQFTDEEINAAWNEKYYYLIKNVSYTADDLLVFCRLTHGGVPQNCSDYATEQITEQGQCYTIHSQKAIDNMGTIYKNHAGLSTSIHITLNLKTDDYYYSQMNGVGMRMRVHSPDNFPYMDRYTTFIAPGTSAVVSVHRVRYEL